MIEPRRLTIDIWSDVMCPWCLVGWGNLRQALDELDGEIAAELRIHQPPERGGDIRNLAIAEREQPGADQRIGQVVQCRAARQRIGVTGEGLLEYSECGVARCVAHAFATRVCATSTASLAGTDSSSRTICTRSGV